MIQKIRNLDPVYYVLYCIFIVFLKYVYFVFVNPVKTLTVEPPRGHDPHLRGPNAGPCGYHFVPPDEVGGGAWSSTAQPSGAVCGAWSSTTQPSGAVWRKARRSDDTRSSRTPEAQKQQQLA